MRSQICLTKLESSRPSWLFWRLSKKKRMQVSSLLLGGTLGLFSPPEKKNTIYKGRLKAYFILTSLSQSVDQVNAIIEINSVLDLFQINTMSNEINEQVSCIKIACIMCHL